MSDGARGSKGRDGTEGRKGSGKRESTSGGRSTEMINASKSPPFASPTYLPTYPTYPRALRLFLPTYLPTYLRLATSIHARSRNFRPAAGERESAPARPYNATNTPRPKFSVRPFVRSYARTFTRSFRRVRTSRPDKKRFMRRAIKRRCHAASVFYRRREVEVEDATWHRLLIKRGPLICNLLEALSSRVRDIKCHNYV